MARLLGDSLPAHPPEVGVARAALSAAFTSRAGSRTLALLSMGHRVFGSQDVRLFTSEQRVPPPRAIIAT